jgi:hypothetical protein
MTDNTVRNNSPDPARYHPNVGGLPGTMIPRAGREGQSLAFDPNKPQTVIVDPGEVGGGFTLDMSALSRTKAKFNSAAVRQEVANDPTAFYRELSEESTELAKAKDEPTIKPQAKTKEPPVMPERIQPLGNLPQLNPAPRLHSLPERTADRAADRHDEFEKHVTAMLEELPWAGRLNPANSVDTAGALQKLLAAERLKADRQLLSASAAQELLGLPKGVKLPEGGMAAAELQEMRDHVAKQGEAINALIGAISQLIEKPAELPVEEAARPKKAVAEDNAPEEEFLAGLASLQIAFLADGKPQRPQYETYFEMTKMGTMAARYHAVVPGQDCVALIYDTRFQDGFQYLPPNLGEERITVSVPKLDEGVYTCSSLGLHLSLGCLDVVILIKHGDKE